MKFWRRMREHFPSFSEGLSLRPCDFSDGKRFPGNFPSFSEGLSLRVRFAEHALTSQRRFPFLFGGAFIEASTEWAWRWKQKYFPSFWEGLSWRRRGVWVMSPCARAFPFLLGRAFIEAPKNHPPQPNPLYPFLLGRAFIEGLGMVAKKKMRAISLPSGKGFH